MNSIHHLLAILSDGNFHSGTELGGVIGVSRTAIWKHINNLKTRLSIKIYSVRGKGYRLEYPVALLDAQVIQQYLSNAVQPLFTSLDVQLQLVSTNQYLIDQLRDIPSGSVVLAEYQSQGRGRRGRSWISPFGCNIYMSLYWKMERTTAEVAGLSLVIGIALVRALRRVGLVGAKIKWPNDIVINGKKLAGILLELRGESNGPCSTVIGMGVNVAMPGRTGIDIDQSWTDINTELGSTSDTNQPDRNRIVALILNELLPCLSKFNQSGLSGFLKDWTEVDALIDKTVTVYGHQTLTEGIVRGINQTGALLVESSGRIQPVYAGDISIRSQTETG